MLHTNQVPATDNNSLTPMVTTAEVFFSPFTVITKALLVLWGLSIARIVPTFTQLGYSAANNTEQLSGQSMAGAGGIVPPSIGDNRAHFWSVYLCCLWRWPNLCGNE